MKNKIKILAIETSCDETAAAVVELYPEPFDKLRVNSSRRVTESMAVKPLSSVVFSQIDIHKKYGGVFPELASREHIKKIEPVVTEALALAQVKSRKYKVESKNSDLLPSTLNLLPSDIDAIAVTVGPGLIGSLIVGVEYARGLATALNKPVIPINHIEGHVYSCFPHQSLVTNHQSRQPAFPLLALVVSGGHTMLVLMRSHLKYEIIGTTLDDAAGECFDKIARMLGLPYPGGPALSRLAEKGDAKAFDFPRSMLNSGDFNFSFSGLKTAVFYKLRDLGLIDDKAEPIAESEIKITKIQETRNKQITNSKIQTDVIPTGAEGSLTHSIDYPRPSASRSAFIRDIAASAQQAIVDVLVKKTFAAAKKYKVKSILVGGGVSANSLLRSEFAKLNVKSQKLNVYLSPSGLATDNALSIAIAACYRYQNGDTCSWHNLDANASLKLSAS